MATKTWPARLCSGLGVLATALLVACGGGGDSGSGTTPADPASSPITTAQALEDAFAVKVASIFIEWTPSTAGFSPFAIGEEFVALWRETPSVTTTGCETVTSEKLGSLPTGIDSVLIVRSNCTYVHGTRGNLSNSQTLTQKLELWTDQSVPERSTWQYRDRYASKQTSNYTMQLANGLELDGQLKGDSTWTNFTDHRADGSQTDTTDFLISGEETSRFGNSNITLAAQIVCTFAAGQLSQAGTCLNGETRATGTVYGRPLNASLEVVSSSPLTYGINLGTQRITVVVDKVGPGAVDSRYRVITPAGKEIALTGEDTLWLSMF